MEDSTGTFAVPSPKRLKVDSSLSKAQDAMSDQYGGPGANTDKSFQSPTDLSSAATVTAPPATAPLPGLGGLKSEEPVQNIRGDGSASNTVSQPGEISQEAPHVDRGFDGPNEPIPAHSPVKIDVTGGDVLMDGQEKVIPKALEAPKATENSVRSEHEDNSMKISMWKQETEIEEQVNTCPDLGNLVYYIDDPATENQIIKQADPHVKSEETKPPSEATFKEIPNANKPNEEAEFEIDSDPYESSDSSESNTLDPCSSSEDSDGDSEEDDYEMMDPEKELQSLMAETRGSPETDAENPTKRPREPPRTHNEKPPEIVPKPDITVTEDMQIRELGKVENLINNELLIKGVTTGEYEVLDFGSVLCLENRSVIGIVAETLGRVQQPYYSVLFTDAAAISDAGIKKETLVFYVLDHSKYIFTKPLQGVKGYDSSNIHDEEVGDDEMEFSDDEAEALHKKELKERHGARRGRSDFGRDGFSRGPRGGRGRGRGGWRQRGGGYAHMPHFNGMPPTPEHAPSSASSVTLNYDDDQPSNELYTPLVRPTNLYSVNSARGPSPPSQPGGEPSFDGPQANGFAGRGRPGGGRGHDNRGSGRGPRAPHGHHPTHHHPLPNSLPHPPVQPNPYAGSQQYPYPMPQSSSFGPNTYNNGNFYPQYSGQSSYHAAQSNQAPQQHHNQGWPIQQPQYANYGQSQGYPMSCQMQQPYSNLPPGSHVNPAFFRGQSPPQGSYNPMWQPPQNG